MTQLTLAEAAETSLKDILEEGVQGDGIRVQGEGRPYMITVRLEDQAEDPPPLTALRGAGPGRSFRTAEEVDHYLRSLREAWAS